MSDTQPTVPPWSTVVEALEARGLREPLVAVVRPMGVTMFEACGRTRSTRIVAARHAAWKKLRELGFSLNEIARLWGVDQSSVSYGLAGVKRRRKKKVKKA